MRTLVVHNSYQQHGGEDSCVLAEIAMLEHYGHQVSQYAASNDAIKTMSRIELAGRTVWSVPAYRDLRSIIRQSRPDVVHFHNTFPLISPAAYYAARMEGVPVVQTLHNYRLFCCNAVLFREGRICESCLGGQIPWRGVIRACYRDSRVASAAVAAMIGAHKVLGTWRNAVDLYIALSESSRNKLIQGGLRADKIVVKPNFVYPDPGVGPGGGGYAMFVGRLSAEKGLLTLIEAWRRMGLQIPLKIVGSGPMSALAASVAGACDTIEFLGQRSPAEVYDLMGRAELLIVPSECQETFGRVVAEGFARGTPALVARIGGLAEIVTDGHNGLVFEPGNALDLADKARGLLCEPDKLQAMRIAARDAFERHFTVETNHAALMAVYERLARRPNRSRIRAH